MSDHNFGTWLKEKRKEKGYTQRALAEAAGGIITHAYISNLELNRDIGKQGRPTRPSIDVVEALAKALQVPTDEARLAAGYSKTAKLIPPDIEAIVDYLLEMPEDWRAMVFNFVQLAHIRLKRGKDFLGLSATDSDPALAQLKSIEEAALIVNREDLPELVSED